MEISGRAGVVSALEDAGRRWNGLDAPRRSSDRLRNVADSFTLTSFANKLLISCFSAHQVA